MKLSIIIPTFNEEGRIIASLVKINDFLKKSRLQAEVIVVDDGSQDKTVEVTKGFKKNFPQLRIIEMGENFGKGWAVRKGVLEAEGDQILFTDADLATPIEELGKLKEKINEGYDLAIASRVHEDGRDERSSTQSMFRRLMGKVFNLLVSALVISGFKDTQCGFKLFKAQAAKKIFLKQRIKRIGFDVEILYLAKKNNLKIAEVPIKWQGGKESRMSIGKELGVIKDILSIRLTQ